MAPLRPSTAAWLLLGAISIAGLLVRIPSFNDALFSDELSTNYIVTGHSLGHVLYLLEDHSVDLNPPLSFVFAWIAEKLGSSPQWIALPSLLSGIAAIPLTYLLGLRTVGRAAAFVGATIVALSPIMIFFSSEARPYALLTLLILLSVLTLLYALDTARGRWWVAYPACSCAALYTNYVAVFPLAALFVWAFMARPEARRALLLANAAAVVGFAPWIPTFLKERHSPGVSVPDLWTPFNLHTVRSDLETLAVGHPFLPLSAMPGAVAIGLVVAGVAAAFVGLGVRSSRRGSGLQTLRPSAGIVLLGVVGLGTLALVAVYSWVGPHTVWDTNKLVCCLPALALLVGALIVNSGEWVRPIGAGLLIAGFAIGAVKMLQASSQRPDYEAAASFINRTGRAGDPVLDWPAGTPGPLTSLEVALTRPGSGAPVRHMIFSIGLPSFAARVHAKPYVNPPVPSDAAVIGQAEAAARGGDLFVVVYWPFHGIPGSAISAAAGKGSVLTGFRLVEVKSLPGFWPVAVALFRRQAPTARFFASPQASSTVEGALFFNLKRALMSRLG